MKSNELNITNSHRHNLRLIGSKDLISMTNLPENDPHYDCAWFSLYDEHEKEINGARVTQHKGTLSYSVQSVAHGRYRLQFLLQSRMESNYFTGGKENISIIINPDRTVYFTTSPVYEHNVKYYNELKSDHAFLERCLQIPPGDNAVIIKKAYEITRGCLTDYQKALAIHDWIGGNIYYDFDSFARGKIDYTKLGTASEVFKSKLAVCAGYSDLARLMLRAVGIPAMTISCYALGHSTVQKWDSTNINNKSNHAITLAFIQKRWVIIDTTWDSGNKYVNSTFKQDEEVKHRFFDSTLQYFSNTHRFCA